MGGGVALFAGADVVLAGESARIGSAFAQIGFSCDSGTSAVLTARMGMARARRFVLLAEMLTSHEALACGLVDRVVPDAALATDAHAVAYGGIKALFHRAGAAHMEAQLELEAQTLARVSRSGDAQEGIAALVEKRKPAFVGR
jgi:2-(1,2-epoxy-1,2-dihydrophenyl)acetyl-CoA isomerase